MDAAPFMVALLIVCASACLADPGSFSLSVVLENKRDETGDFRVELENASDEVVWTWSQSVAPGGVVQSDRVVFPDGLYYVLALTEEASCSRGPGMYEARRITLFIELPEFGRTLLHDGSAWPPDQLNCVFMHE